MVGVVNTPCDFFGIKTWQISVFIFFVDIKFDASKMVGMFYYKKEVFWKL